MRSGLNIATVSAIVALGLAVGAVFVLRPAWYVRWREPVHYSSYITTHSANHELPPALVAAVIQQESGFDPHARSGAGAVGLMQLTAETARGIATRTGGSRFEQGDLLDPEINIRYGVWYLAHLHRKYDERSGGGGAEDYALALAAYNAGQGNVDTWLETRTGADDVLAVEEIPFEETRAYVRDVVRQREDYERAYPDLR